MDRIGLSNSDALADILRTVKHDIRLVCGHIHSVKLAMVGGHPALSVPATCSTFDVDFRTDAPVGFLDGPGGFLLHEWGEGLHTHHVPPAPGDGPWPFNPETTC